MANVSGPHEKRHQVICNGCKKEMIFAKDIMRSKDKRFLYLKYICPHRRGEPGCGATKVIRLEVDRDARYLRIKNNFIRQHEE